MVKSSQDLAAWVGIGKRRRGSAKELGRSENEIPFWEKGIKDNCRKCGDVLPAPTMVDGDWHVTCPKCGTQQTYF